MGLVGRGYGESLGETVRDKLGYIWRLSCGAGVSGLVGEVGWQRVELKQEPGMLVGRQSYDVAWRCPHARMIRRSVRGEPAGSQDLYLHLESRGALRIAAFVGLQMLHSGRV